jgi:hypothetical protein
MIIDEKKKENQNYEHLKIIPQIFRNFNSKLTKVRCSFVVKNLVIGKRHVGNVAVNGG